MPIAKKLSQLNLDLKQQESTSKQKKMMCAIHFYYESRFCRNSPIKKKKMMNIYPMKKGLDSMQKAKNITDINTNQVKKKKKKLHCGLRIALCITAC